MSHRLRDVVRASSLIWALLMLLMVAWRAALGQAVEVREDEKSVTLANGHLRMTFSRERNGALVSLADVKSGREFLAPKAEGPSLYQLSAVGPERKKMDLSSADAQGVEVRVERGADRAVVSVTAASHREHPIRVSVSVTMTADSSMASWRVECANNAPLAINAISCPALSVARQLGDSPADDHLLWPACDGLLFTDLTQNKLQGSGALTYPGSASVQFTSFYDDAAGLFLASRDAEAYPKRLAYQLRKAQVNLSIAYLFSEVQGPTVLRTPETVVGVFHGDWYDAADLYKAWAVKQPWCARATTQRDDIPKWFLAAPPMLDYSLPHPDRREDWLGVSEIPPCLAGYTQFLGQGVLARPQGWEKQGAWVGPDCFPPYGEDAFVESVRRMRKDGNRLFLYLEGYQWMLNDPGHKYDGNAFFEQHCGADAVVGEDGQVKKGVHGGRTYAEGCAATRSAREIVVQNAMQCIEVGADAVQIEVVGGGGPPCYSTTHGHPIGYGKWFYENFAALLDTVRMEGRKRNPDLVVTIEEPHELYLQHLDGYNGRDYRQTDWPRGAPGSVGVPLFTYIYHEYALGFSGWHYVSGKDWMQIRDIAANFICGKMDGINFPAMKGRWEAKDANPDALGFFKKTVQARATFAHPYLILGKMLRPASIECKDFTFDYGVKVKDKWEKRSWTEPIVTHSVWKSPSGKIGCVLVNFSDEKAPFTVELRPYDLAGGAFKAEWVDGQGRKVLFEKESLPRKLKAELGSREAALIELSPSAQ